jgi:ATP-dependent protease ClpP protease subunit
VVKLGLFFLVALLAGYVWQAQHRCEAEWTGFIGMEMRQQAQNDLEAASGCDVLVISLYSPGGSVFDTLEMVRLVEQAKRTGLVVEIRGHTLIASGATFLLGAGSPGHRYVEPETLVLIHGIQVGWYGCQDHKAVPMSENELFLNTVYEQMAMTYARLSGRSIRETWGWLECGNAQAGNGWLLKNLGLADHVGG